MPKVRKRKTKISITIDDDLRVWVEEQVRKNRFSSVSHACSYALRRLKESESPQTGEEH